MVTAGARVNLADLLIVAVIGLAAVGGARVGMVARLAAWIGMAIGLVVALRVMPWVLGLLGAREDLVVMGVVAVTLFAGLAAGQSVGLAVGARIRPRRRNGVLGTADRTAGALVAAAAVVVVLWMLVPMLSRVGGTVSAQVTGSGVLQLVDRHLPDPPDTLQALRSLAGDVPFPEVFAALGPTPDLGPPPAETGIDAATATRVAESVVLVRSAGCATGQSGTGYVGGARRDSSAGRLVVTNAHVVAGGQQVEVESRAGSLLDAEVVVFDPEADVAVLWVEGLDGGVLPQGSASNGASGGVFGHPGGGPLRVAPARAVSSLTAAGRDIYGRLGPRRTVVELAASLARGDSGAPVVSPEGDVVGTVFAIASDRSDVAYALAPEVVSVAIDAGRANEARPVDTGACIR